MRVQVVDSHTGGEPTRLVLSGAPDLGSGTVREQLIRFREQHDKFRSAVVNEPRGNDAIVGALICKAADSACQLGVIFFNNVGFIQMCGHGTIGLVATLAHLGKLQPGLVHIETSVGVVIAELHESGEVTVRNVPSYRYAKDVTVEVEGYGPVTGDIAWGGNWFFLTRDYSPIELKLENLEELTTFTWRIRKALERHNIRGNAGAEIDHVELFAAPRDKTAHSRNFVLCPGKSYDRSPCGTGTSAKMACLYEDSLLRPGNKYRQESIVGSIFEGHVELVNGEIIPFIRGSAFVTAQSELVIDERDPFRWGIPT